MTQVLYLMATLSSGKALKIIENEIPAGEPKKNYGPASAPNKKCGHTHMYSVQKVRTSISLTFMQRSARTWKFLCLFHGILSDVLDPMVLVRGIDSKILSPVFWVPCIGLLLCCVPLHLRCGSPVGLQIEPNYQSSNVPQTVRSTDLIMRQRDHDLSIDLPYNLQFSP